MAPQTTNTAQRGRRVWVIDDSKLEAEMARRALAIDHDVEIFNDSSVALEQLTARAPPEVLILDWVMPGLSGIDVCEFVRARFETKQLPVLLLTTNQETAQIVEGLSAGANDYLAKPYAPAELRARVEALLRSHDLLKRAEHAEGLLRRVLSQLRDAVVTVDANGAIIFANSALESACGARLEGKQLADVLPALSVEKLNNASAKAQLADLTLGARILSPSLSIAASDDLGNTTITLRDVTEQRERESRRVDFYSMVAHDLRSPLSALQGRAQMMLRGLRGPLSPEVQQDLTKMVARVRDLVQIVNDFLDIEEMESARFELEEGEVDLSLVCREVCDEYQPIAASRGLELTLFNKEPELLVSGDSRRLAQVIGNLVSNALKFTSAGQVFVGVEVEDRFAEVRVTDTGRGIPLEAQARLFSKYERVPGSNTARVEGTGLGLAIVKEIIEAHKGNVGMRSAEGQGSTFWIRLPRSTKA
jgi:signal transduction histidine kinase